MDAKYISQNKVARGIIFIICILIVLLFVFQAGMTVGYSRAVYSSKLGDNYYRAFGPEGRMRFMRGFPGNDLPGGHGVVGKIVRLSLPTITVASPDNVEKIVLITNNTIIRKFRDTLSQTDLKLDDTVVVLGSPNSSGEVEAKLIRLMSPISNSLSTTTPKR
jgi:hypothetical protein